MCVCMCVCIPMMVCLKQNCFLWFKAVYVYSVYTKPGSIASLQLGRYFHATSKDRPNLVENTRVHIWMIKWIWMDVLFGLSIVLSIFLFNSCAYLTNDSIYTIVSWTRVISHCGILEFWNIACCFHLRSVHDTKRISIRSIGNETKF